MSTISVRAVVFPATPVSTNVNASAFATPLVIMSATSAQYAVLRVIAVESDSNASTNVFSCAIAPNVSVNCPVSTFTLEPLRYERPSLTALKLVSNAISYAAPVFSMPESLRHLALSYVYDPKLLLT